MTTVLLLLILAVLLFGRARSQRAAVWLLKATGLVVLFVFYVVVIAPRFIDPRVKTIMTKVPGMPLSSTIALVIEMVIFGAMLIGVVAASLLLSENVVADQVSMTVMLLQPGAQGCTVAFVRR